MNNQEMMVNQVKEKMLRAGFVEIEVSARHVHLCEKDMVTLFGKKELDQVRELSQPGEFLSAQKVELVGPKRSMPKVSILGPLRKQTQVEISKSDAIQLGIDCPLRLSGDVKNSGKVTIVGPNGKIDLNEGVIVAQNHIHMTEYQASVLKLKNNDKVNVRVCSVRPLTFEDVVVRINNAYNFRMHVDFDEANAAFISGFTLGQIIKKK